MNLNNIRRLDITALLVFAAVMRGRKTREVAEAMGLTQSAVSHALNRLRDALDDPLFLRRPHGLEPTALARRLEPKIEAVLAGLDALSAPEPDFDPAAAVGALRLAAYDYELGLLAPALIARLRDAAPGLRVSATAKARRDALVALRDGRCDLAMGYFRDPPEDMIQDTLFEEHYRVVASRQRQPGLKALTMDAYLDADHLLVSPVGEFRGVVDDALERLGAQRRVAASVPLFFPALAAVARSRLIATVPAGLADAYAAAFDLAVFEPPLALRAFPVSVLRHRRDAKNPLLSWVVGELRALARRPE